MEGLDGAAIVSWTHRSTCPMNMNAQTLTTPRRVPLQHWSVHFIFCILNQPCAKWNAAFTMQNRARVEGTSQTMSIISFIQTIICFDHGTFPCHDFCGSSNFESPNNDCMRGLTGRIGSWAQFGSNKCVLGSNCIHALKFQQQNLAESQNLVTPHTARRRLSREPWPARCWNGQESQWDPEYRPNKDPQNLVWPQNF